jgi:hypothetical protein
MENEPAKRERSRRSRAEIAIESSCPNFYGHFTAALLRRRREIESLTRSAACQRELLHSTSRPFVRLPRRVFSRSRAEEERIEPLCKRSVNPIWQMSSGFEMNRACRKMKLSRLSLGEAPKSGTDPRAGTGIWGPVD